MGVARAANQCRTLRNFASISRPIYIFFFLFFKFHFQPSHAISLASCCFISRTDETIQQSHAARAFKTQVLFYLFSSGGGKNDKVNLLFVFFVNLFDVKPTVCIYHSTTCTFHCFVFLMAFLFFLQTADAFSNYWQKGKRQSRSFFLQHQIPLTFVRYV